jgi:hypothetical protein
MGQKPGQVSDINGPVSPPGKGEGQPEKPEGNWLILVLMTPGLDAQQAGRIDKYLAAIPGIGGGGDAVRPIDGGARLISPSEPPRAWALAGLPTGDVSGTDIGQVFDRAMRTISEIDSRNPADPTYGVLIVWVARGDERIPTEPLRAPGSHATYFLCLGRPPEISRLEPWLGAKDHIIAQDTTTDVTNPEGTDNSIIKALKVDFFGILEGS